MRRGDLGLLAQRAQRRGLAQIAGLDDDAAVARRRGEQRLDRRQRYCGAADLQPEPRGGRRTAEWYWLPRPAAPDCRRAPRSRCAPARTDRSGSSTEACTSASTRSRTSPASGPNTSTIGMRRIGLGDELVDVEGFDGGHDFRRAEQLFRSPPRNTTPGAMRMLSAITLAARSSASRRPRSPAKRCCWPGNIVGHAREGLAVDHRLAGGDRSACSSRRCRNSGCPGARC